MYLKTKYGHKVCTYIVYIYIVQTYDIYINHGVKMNEPYIDSLESYSDIAMNTSADPCFEDSSQSHMQWKW